MIDVTKYAKNVPAGYVIKVRRGGGMYHVYLDGVQIDVTYDIDYASAAARRHASEARSAK
jgi:hypothetical protein